MAHAREKVALGAKRRLGKIGLRLQGIESMNHAVTLGQEAIRRLAEGQPERVDFIRYRIRWLKRFSF
jgi:hypothetical protein